MRQEFFQQKPDILVTQRVVFKTSILPGDLIWAGRRNFPWIDEQADGDWHLTTVNEIIEDRWRTKATLVIHITSTVIEDHQTSGLGCLILSRHIDPIIADRPGKNVTVPDIMMQDSPGHSRLGFGIWAQRIIHCGHHARDQQRYENTGGSK